VGVTVHDQMVYTNRFFQECMAIMQAKGTDYAPKNIAVSEAWWTAAETNTTPEAVIYNAMRKHWGAVQTAVLAGRPLEGDTLHNHLVDIANYAVILDFITVHRKEFLLALSRWCDKNPCTKKHAGDDPCDTCLMLPWLYPNTAEIE